MVNTIQMTQTGYDELAKELEAVSYTHLTTAGASIKSIPV